MIAERAGGVSGRNRRTGKFRNREADSLKRKIAYLVSPDPRFEGLPPGRRVALAGGTQVLPWLPGDDPEGYAEGVTAALEQWNQTMRGERKASQNLCIDRSFSFAPGDPVDPLVAVSIVEELIERVMGVDERLALYVVHTDKPHLHVHVIASVVDCHGKIFNPRNDDYLWEQAMNELERENGLQEVHRPWIGTPRRSSGVPVPFNKRGAAKRRSPQKDSMRQAIEAAVAEAQGVFQDFLAALDRRDIQLIAHQSSEEAEAPVAGISFYRDGEHFTGSQLSPDLAWPALRARIGYEHKQHQELLLQRTHRYQTASQVLCSIRPVSQPAMRSNVIELPDSHLDKRKQQVLASVRREEVSNAQIVYRWPRSIAKGFQEFNSAETEARSPKSGFAAFLTKRGPRLTTHNGMNRNLIKRMLVRACQLGWRRVIVEGSAEFVKLAKEICQKWLKGTVRDQQAELVQPPVESMIIEVPLSSPAPVPPPSLTTSAVEEPVRIRDKKPQVAVGPHEEPSMGGHELGAEVGSGTVDMEMVEGDCEGINPAIAERDSASETPSKPEYAPDDASAAAAPIGMRQPGGRRPVRIRRKPLESNNEPSM